MPIIPEYATTLAQFKAGNIYSFGSYSSAPKITADDILPVVREDKRIAVYQGDQTYPAALGGSRLALFEGLREGARGSAGARSHWFQHSLIVVEVADPPDPMTRWPVVQDRGRRGRSAGIDGHQAPVGDGDRCGGPARLDLHHAAVGNDDWGGGLPRRHDERLAGRDGDRLGDDGAA